MYETRYQLQDKNHKKHKHKHMGRVNNPFLNKKHVTEEIKMEIKKFLEPNDNENTTQKLWDTAKVVLGGKFITIKSYLKKQEKH